jgi:hypothetical protein
MFPFLSPGSAQLKGVSGGPENSSLHELRVERDGDWSPARMPPVSSAAFRAKPKSLRLIVLSGF